MVSRKQMLKIEKRLDQQKDMEIKTAIDKIKKEFDKKLVDMRLKCDDSIKELKNAKD